ncbi:MAG: mechanosensitive ion channel, partial [Dehalococcoidales bacterium]|nr:mechanosensitive ion channel [Dehalococcoidales bacterium]
MPEWLNTNAIFADGVNLLGKATALVVILGLTLVACSLIGRLESSTVAAAIERARTRNEPNIGELTKRYQTLGRAIGRTAVVVVWTVAIVTALSQFIDIAPILASAGVVGIALGLGAQTLVKDYLAGLFLILENQYGKGDVVTVAGVSGLVEEINLRRTVLRD